LRSSYVPPPELRELRALLRYRVKLINARSGERNRVTKLLESCNIKLSSVASDVFGLSGRLMLDALKRGQASPEEMAELAKGRMRSKLPLLKLALEGRSRRPRHRSPPGSERPGPAGEVRLRRMPSRP